MFKRLLVIPLSIFILAGYSEKKEVTESMLIGKSDCEVIVYKTIRADEKDKIAEFKNDTIHDRNKK